MGKEPSRVAQQRIDKWLFFTRMAKSRGFAQALIAAGAVRVNGQPCGQASRMVRIGDRIELLLERRDVVLIVRDCGERRGPFEEARSLYNEVNTDVPAPRLTPFEQAQRTIRPASFSR
jgi:ribosome-associated heat shock protein Hsp15